MVRKKMNRSKGEGVGWKEQSLRRCEKAEMKKLVSYWQQKVEGSSP